MKNNKVKTNSKINTTIEDFKNNLVIDFSRRLVIEGLITNYEEMTAFRTRYIDEINKKNIPCHSFA